MVLYWDKERKSSKNDNPKLQTHDKECEPEKLYATSRKDFIIQLLLV